LPVTATLYVPLAPEATVKDPDTTPPDTEHVEADEISPVGDEDIEQLPVSPAKFDPETLTLDPTSPEFGDKVTVGETNFAVSVIGPFMVMVAGLLVPE
jgi:hypothetical protein